MFKCWNSDPNERPSFSALANSISGFAEMTAGYLDVSNYNPFEANVSTATTGAENGHIQTEVECDTIVPWTILQLKSMCSAPLKMN